MILLIVQTERLSMLSGNISEPPSSPASSRTPGARGSSRIRTASVKGCLFYLRVQIYPETFYLSFERDNCNLSDVNCCSYVFLTQSIVKITPKLPPGVGFLLDFQ